MRAELIRVALVQESNRFLLTQVIAKATRKMHRPHTRIADTMNEVIALVSVNNSKGQVVSRQPASIQLRRAA